MKYFLLKIKREKSIPHFEKYKFETIGDSVHTTEYLAFGKDLLARLYLNVYILVYFWGFRWAWKINFNYLY